MLMILLGDGSGSNANF